MNKLLRRRIRESIDRGIKKRRELGEFNSFLRLLRTKELETDFDILSTVICFNIGSPEELRNTRRMLRREFNVWEDELAAVECWHSKAQDDYWVTFRWQGKHLPVRIDLETLYKNLPEELKLLKEGCRFKEVITPIEAQGATESRLLSYVCDT